MAVTQGVAKINGVAIANVSKDGGVAKANIWSIGSTQRQASLFKTLLNQNWGSYTAGKNSASFSATGSGSSSAQVYFQYDNHSAGDTYTFTFNKQNTTTTKTFACSASQNTAFDTSGNTQNIPIPTGTGVQSVTNTYAGTNSTIYLAISLVGASTNTIEINDLIVTKS
tara:strand:+ start:87 stop:590 length:504 start_codon:yes stop_codon:yes gene_type:complete